MLCITWENGFTKVSHATFLREEQVLPKREKHELFMTPGVRSLGPCLRRGMKAGEFAECKTIVTKI